MIYFCEKCDAKYDIDERGAYKCVSCGNSFYVKSVQLDAQTIKKDMSKFRKIFLFLNQWAFLICMFLLLTLVCCAIYIILELDYIRYNVRSCQSDISSIESDVSSIESDISSIKSDIRSIEFDVSSIEFDVSSIESDVSSIESDVSSIESDVSSIEIDVSSIKYTINFIQ